MLQKKLVIVNPSDKKIAEVITPIAGAALPIPITS